MISQVIKNYLSILSLLATGSVLSQSIQYSGIDIPDNSGKVMTVTGLIDPNLLGPMLMHEHLFLDISKLAKKPLKKKILNTGKDLLPRLIVLKSYSLKIIFYSQASKMLQTRYGNIKN